MYPPECPRCTNAMIETYRRDNGGMDRVNTLKGFCPGCGLKYDTNDMDHAMGKPASFFDIVPYDGPFSA